MHKDLQVGFSGCLQNLGGRMEKGHLCAGALEGPPRAGQSSTHIQNQSAKVFLILLDTTINYHTMLEKN